MKQKRAKSRISQWKNTTKKLRGKVYNGQYRWVRGEREFLLVNCEKPKDKVLPFNSHEHAKGEGWKKIK